MLSAAIQPGTQEQHQALDGFGLQSATLEQIGTRILGAYNQSTPHDALTAAGTYAYLAAVRGLRDGLCHLGWEAYRKQNLEMVLAPSKQFAIIASSGDKNTGRDGEEPKTKNPKGVQTGELIVKNRNQGYLFSEMIPKITNSDIDSIPTWFLLYHMDSENNEMRMELSLPISVDMNDLRVDQWKDRILLSAIKFDAIPAVKTKSDFYSEFDIEIKRKING